MSATAPSASPLARRLAPWLALTGLVLLAFLVVSPFLVPLVWAGVLAYASWPLAESIRARCGGRDTLAASLAVGLAALTLFAPVLWLGWVAQQEVGGVVRTLLAFVAAPPDVPEFLRGIPWLGDWLAQQRALLLADPQGVITALKAWFAAHAGDAAQLAGGIGRNLAKLVLVLVILFFFYRDGARMVSELRHVLARFIGSRAHGYLVVRSIKTNTYQVRPRSNLFQRNTTGAALISAMPLRTRSFRSSFELTRMCRRKVRAIFEKAHSIKLSQEPCLGV